jgi:uncharacterized protein (DUF58 family)
MGKFSRDKGKRGERATAAEIRAVFPDLDIKRGWQTRSGRDDADVVGLAVAGRRIWIEVKSGRQPNPRAALTQAVAAAPPEALPIAVIRDDRKSPFAALRWSDLLALLVRAHAAPPLPASPPIAAPPPPLDDPA